MNKYNEKRYGRYSIRGCLLFLALFLPFTSVQAVGVKKGDTVTDGTFTYIILSKATKNKEGSVAVYGLNKNVFNDKDASTSNDSPKTLSIPAKIKYNHRYYSITATGSSGKATLAGTSSTYQYYWGNAETIVLPDSVTIIGDNSFAKAEHLTQIELPSTVTAIGGEAFSKTNLKKITIPSSVMFIGRAAFWKCESLQTVKFNKGLNVIGKWAFQQSGLTKAALPEGLLEVKQAAFSGCGALEQAALPSTVTKLGKGVFSECDALETLSVKKKNQAYQSKDNIIYSKDGMLLADGGAAAGNIQIQEGTQKIAAGAFYRNQKMTALTIPDTVTEIQKGAFAECKKLKKVSLGMCVETIRASAFAKCTTLQEIVFPDSVEIIGNSAFYQNTALSAAEFGKNIISIGNQAFSYCSLQSAVLPETLVSIGKAAFQGNRQLARVSIPANTMNIADNVFASCKNLTELSVAEENQVYASIDGALYTKNAAELLAWPSAKGNVVILDSVVTIGNCAFQGTAISSVTIPDTVLKIEEGAFASCEELLWVKFEGNEVLLPAKTKNKKGISTAVFYSCFALQTVSAPQIDEKDSVQQGFAERLKKHMDSNGVLAWLQV